MEGLWLKGTDARTLVRGFLRKKCDWEHASWVMGEEGASVCRSSTYYRARQHLALLCNGFRSVDKMIRPGNNEENFDADL